MLKWKCPQCNVICIEWEVFIHFVGAAAVVRVKMSILKLLLNFEAREQISITG